MDSLLADCFLNATSHYLFIVLDPKEDRDSSSIFFLLFESEHCLIVRMLMARLRLGASDGCKGYGLQLYSLWH